MRTSTIKKSVPSINTFLCPTFFSSMTVSEKFDSDWGQDTGEYS
jgi:hypothetical protein